MTQIQPESHAEARLSGRELARQRRKAMATQGKTAVRPTRKTAGVTAVASSHPSRTQSVQTQARGASAVATNQSGRAKAQQRRTVMGRSGKAELPNSRTGSRPARAMKNKFACNDGCSCGCKPSSSEVEATVSPVFETQPAVAVSSTPLTPGEIASRLVRNHVRGSGRDVALARRQALSQDGKAGLRRASQATKIAKYLPEKDWRVAISKGVNGRQLAMQRRKVRSLTGRGEEPQKANVKTAVSRGRRAAQAMAAPQKVGRGHTLAGSDVTGTMVDRIQQVTGNESGACRSVTGTEYIGIEQFDAFCKDRPKASPSKVTLSRTLNGRNVSGTSLSSDTNITGSEYGACRDVTGTQYLSAEDFERNCSSRPQPPANKVGTTRTSKGEVMTGTLLNPQGRVTGNEIGRDREVTGTRYARATHSSVLPEKVAVTHTHGGGEVTGTSVGRSSRVTGDEPGSCASVSGTQYLSAEQYTELCNTAVPRQPHKISVMSTLNEQKVTGNSVARDRKVTGGESGSVLSITGTPYFNSQDFGDAKNMEGPDKVGLTHTRSGTRVSGTEVLSNPKMTGDEEGRCALVTGIDYVGARDLKTSCAESTPVDQAIVKVGQDRTLQGEVVTGSSVDRSLNVTGNEFGACAPVSGTSYAGRNQYGEFCEPGQSEEQLARMPTRGVVSAAEITGDRPGAGGSVMTGDERGACEPISGTPYLGADNMPSQCPTGVMGAGKYATRRRELAEPSRPAAPSGFSVVSPARQSAEEALNRTVTGAQMNNDRITGSVSRAQGVITGTPEFRHRDGVNNQSVVNQDSDRQRLTGEASPRTAQITGDAWSMQKRVTGTEGHFSSTRNPTQRGNPRGTGRNAQAYRDIERPEVPASPVTGSAGAAKRGAVVTVSGGARG